MSDLNAMRKSLYFRCQKIEGRLKKLEEGGGGGGSGSSVSEADFKALQEESAAKDQKISALEADLSYMKAELSTLKESLQTLVGEV